MTEEILSVQWIDSPPALNRAANRAGAAAPDRADQLAALLARVADPLVDDWVEKVRNALDTAISQGKSPDDFRDSLIDLLPDMDAAQFAQVMQHALAAAGVAGMSDAADDSHA
jgi:phage gp29-like protein